MNTHRGIGTLAAFGCVALSMSAAVARSDQTASPTFNKDVAPILFSRCAPCHRPDGPAPFDLLSFDAAKRRASQIAEVTRTRLMPPWKAEPGFGGDFVDQHPLSASEIDLIGRWAEAGAPEGEPRELPRLPARAPGWLLGTPDQIITFAEPYTLAPEGTDVLRIFVLPIPLGARRYVKGLEFRPGNSAVVHHANIRIDRSPRSRQLDEEDPAPGYEGLMANSAMYPDGHFLGWTPGQVAPLLPKGLAWTLDPGADLVVELHLQPTGRPEKVAPSFGLFYTDDPPTRAPVMLRLGRQDMDIPAGEDDYTITDSYVLPVDVEIQAVQPHAHYRAREVRGVATLPDGTTRWLIYIKDWDFRWQHVYRSVKPLPLPRGTTLTMRFSYDNSAANPRNPRRPPERAFWGQRSSDEMGNLWIQVLPRNGGDLEALHADFRPKAAADDAAGYEMMLRRDPLNVNYHNDAALLYIELGLEDRAIAHFDVAVELQPASAATHFNLGTALLHAGRLDAAVRSLERALGLRPDYVLAHTNLGNALAAQGKFDAAVATYRLALGLDPQSAVLHNNIGQALVMSGQTAEALRHFRDAIQLDPLYAEPFYNLGRAAAAAGGLSDAVGHLRRAVAIRPEWVAALVDLGELLGSAPDERVLNPDEAVRLSERAVLLTKRGDARALDVLAAAYAAQGRFERALEAVGLALQLEQDGSGAAAMRERAELYRQHRPYRLGR